MLEETGPALRGAGPVSFPGLYPEHRNMTLEIEVLAADRMSPLQVDQVIDLCGGVFDCDYRSLLAPECRGAR